MTTLDRSSSRAWGPACPGETPLHDHDDRLTTVSDHHRCIDREFGASRYSLSVLASLLPGIREIRAPLAAGYLWLIVGWIWLGEDLRERRWAPQLVDNLALLGTWAGKVVILGAVTFVAYIVGMLSVTTNVLFEPHLNTIWHRRRLVRFNPDSSISTILIDRRYSGPRLITGPIVRRVLDHHRVRMAQDTSYRDSVISQIDKQVEHCKMIYPDATYLLGDETFSEWLANDQRVQNMLYEVDGGVYASVAAILSDLDSAAQRLIGVDPELYTEFDRSRAEAEFRFGLAIPASALAMTLFYHMSMPVWLAGGLAGVALAWLGKREYVRAYSKVANWLVAGRIDSPAFQRALDARASPESSPLLAHVFVVDNFFSGVHRHPADRLRERLRKLWIAMGPPFPEE